MAIQLSSWQPPVWDKFEHVNNCTNPECNRMLPIWLMKHHCRRCGHIFCDDCTAIRIPLPPVSYTPVRVCERCYRIHHSLPSNVTKMIQSPSSVPPPLASSSSSSAAPPSSAPPSSSTNGVKGNQNQTNGDKGFVSSQQEKAQDDDSGNHCPPNSQIFLGAFNTSAAIKDYTLHVLRRRFPAIDNSTLETILVSFQGDMLKTAEYLSSTDSSPQSSASTSSSARNLLDEKHNNDSSKTKTSVLSIPSSIPFIQARQLSYEQKFHFYLNGFLHLPRMVSRELTDRAVAHINHQLGDGINKLDFHTELRNGQQTLTYCPPIKSSPALLDLFARSGVIDLVESLMGPFPSPGGVQIALVFPNATHYGTIPQWFHRDVIREKTAWHIDGIPNGKNGVPQEKLSNFTMLVGIYLQDADVPYAGNFTVFPGSHHLLQAHCRLDDLGPLSLLYKGLPKIDIPEPHQLRVKAGDIVLAHYQLSHAVAPNVSPHVRYALYFRLTSSRRENQQRRSNPNTQYDCMTNIWMEYEGLWPVVKEWEGKYPYMNRKV